jgi:hypothetical protein
MALGVDVASVDAYVSRRLDFRVALVAAKLNDGTSVQVAVVVGACKSSALGHDLGRCPMLLPSRKCPL